MPEGGRILLAGLFTVAVCLAAGTVMLGRLPVRLSRAEHWALALPLGAPVVSMAVFLACVLGIARAPVFAATGIALLAAAAWLRPRISPQPPGIPKAWRWTAAVVAIPFGALYLLHAWSPEYSPDGASYHLGVVGRYLRAQGFERITTNMYANLSQGIDLLFLFAYAFGRHSAAALTHLAFLGALPALLLAYGRRSGAGAAGAFAACLVFASPVFGIDGASAYNDVAVAALLFTVFYLTRLWAEQPSLPLSAAAGFVAGFCYGCKYTAFLAVPYGLLAIGIGAWRKRLPGVAHLAVFSAAALAMIAPWLIKNWVYLDNPFSPLLNRWFPNPYIHISFEDEYRHLMRNYEGIRSYWMIPAQVLYRGEFLAGILGPVFGLTPLALLGVRRPQVRALLLAGLLFGLPYLSNIGCRFLIPAAPFFALALGVVLTDVLPSRARWLALAVALGHGWLSWPSQVEKYSAPGAWRMPLPDWRAALRLKPESEFLQERLGGYGLARLVERNTEPGARILLFTPLPEAYCERDLLVAYQSAEGNQLRDILFTPLMPEALPVGRQEFVFEAGRYRRLRIEQTAAGSELWSISEARLYHGGRETPRAASWRIRASANPWGIADAFDNNPATRWRSWQRIEPGMSVEIDFGAPARVDRVVLEMSNDQYQVRMRLAGLGADGRWRTLGETAAATEPAPAPAALRRAAGLELQARRVDYVVVRDNEWGAEEFRSQADAWGMAPVAAGEGGVVYRWILP
jgi:hypothetical protein